MKNLLKIILTFSPLLLIGASCKEESIDLPVSYQFQLLDEQGNQSTTFQKGENFFVNFSIINNSDEIIYFNQNSLNKDNFFRVFEKVVENNKIQMIDYGKPYSGMFCLEHYAGGIPIPANGSVDFKFAWHTDKEDNLSQLDPFCRSNAADFLEKGNYVTKFSSHFIFSKGEERVTTDTLQFQINFEIN